MASFGRRCAEDPRVLEHLQRFIVAFGRDASSATSIDDASGILSEVTQDKRALIVLDDAWQPENVRPFLALGPRCALIVTTREWNVTDAAEAWIHELPPFAPYQSLELIERRLGRGLTVAEQDLAQRVAEAVGHLPISILLACARIEEGDSWDHLSSELEDEQKRLYILEPPEFEEKDGRAAVHRSVVASFNLSLNRLSERDRRAFSLLSLLAEDVAFTAEVAATLWDTSEQQAEETLRRLHRKGLLMAQGVREGRQLYQQHDEQRNAGRRALGLLPADGHGRLVEAYGVKLAEGLWSSLKDDGYVHDHLIQHLLGAGLRAEVHALLREERDSHNAWFLARQSNIEGYLHDLDMATEAAAGAAAEARYAAIRSSIAGIGKKLPSGVVKELVRRGKWSPSRAFGWAIGQPAADRFNEIAGLAQVLEGPWQKRCVDAAIAEIGAAQGKTHLIYALPFVLTEQSQNDLLRIAKAMPENRAPCILAALRHFIARGRAEEALGELDALGTELTAERLAGSGIIYLLNANELKGLMRFAEELPFIRFQTAVRLASLGEIEDALACIEDLNGGLRADAIREIAEDLENEHLAFAESLARGISDEAEQAQALAALFSAYEEPLRSERLGALWSEVDGNPTKAMENARQRIIGRLSAPVLKEQFEALFIDPEDIRPVAKRFAHLGRAAEAFELIKELPESQLDSALADVASHLYEQHLIELGVTRPEPETIGLAHMLPRWAELGHGAEAVRQLAHLRSKASVHGEVASRMAAHLDDASLESLAAECEIIGDRVEQLRVLASRRNRS